MNTLAFSDFETVELVDLAAVEGGGLFDYVESVAKGAVIGGAAGAVTGAVSGAIGGTAAAPGPGTLAGAATGAVAGWCGGAVTGGLNYLL